MEAIPCNAASGARLGAMKLPEKATKWGNSSVNAVRASSQLYVRRCGTVCQDLHHVPGAIDVHPLVS